MCKILKIEHGYGLIKDIKRKQKFREVSKIIICRGKTFEMVLSFRIVETNLGKGIQLKWQNYPIEKLLI